MSKIFLSYRREDTAGIAGRIHDRLEARFGSNAIFMDVDSIPYGIDFRTHIATAVGQCGVFLAVIGPRWEAASAEGRRIDDPADYVRTELEAALARNLPIIPVLIDRSGIPAESGLPASLAFLRFRNAISVDQGADFNHDVQKVVKGIEFHLNSAKQASAARRRKAKTISSAEEVDGVMGRARNVLRTIIKAGLADPSETLDPTQPARVQIRDFFVKLQFMPIVFGLLLTAAIFGLLGLYFYFF